MLLWDVLRFSFECFFFSLIKCLCNWNILHTEIRCPDPINSTSTSASFPRPEANFDVTSPYYYSQNGEMFTKLPSSSSHHSLLYFDRGETTNVTLSVAGASGMGATCSFMVYVASFQGIVKHCSSCWYLCFI